MAMNQNSLSNDGRVSSTSIRDLLGVEVPGWSPKDKSILVLVDGKLLLLPFILDFFNPSVPICEAWL